MSVSLKTGTRVHDTERNQDGTVLYGDAKGQRAFVRLFPTATITRLRTDWRPLSKLTART